MSRTTIHWLHLPLFPYRGILSHSDASIFSRISSIHCLRSAGGFFRNSPRSFPHGEGADLDAGLAGGGALGELGVIQVTDRGADTYLQLRFDLHMGM